MSLCIDEVELRGLRSDKEVEPTTKEVEPTTKPPGEYLWLPKRQLQVKSSLLVELGLY